VRSWLGSVALQIGTSRIGSGGLIHMQAGGPGGQHKRRADRLGRTEAAARCSAWGRFPRFGFPTLRLGDLAEQAAQLAQTNPSGSVDWGELETGANRNAFMPFSRGANNQLRENYWNGTQWTWRDRGSPGTVMWRWADQGLP
jgi:hypothetical protein